VNHKLASCGIYTFEVPVHVFHVFFRVALVLAAITFDVEIVCENDFFAVS